MRNFTTLRLVTFIFALTVLAVPPVLGASGGMGIGPQSGPQTVPEGKKMKIKGVVMGRTADGFLLKNAKFVETSVVLTDSSRVEIDNKPVTAEQRLELARLVGGIIAQVEGVGNASGQLVAEKINVAKKDVRNALAVANKLAPVESRVTDVETSQKALSGDVAELDELTKMANAEAARAHERISALDNFEVKDSAAVVFVVNKADLTAEGKAALDALVAKGAAIKGAAYEITGYTDTTGNAEQNRVLSEKRANAVITYMTDSLKVPLRRIVTPLGYGEARPVADNSTPEGRVQNRRVEVRLMQQSGVSS